ncbi:rCG55307 [Rattus norvegicus]|uniref:RCG55307 n=1 Tax=Rattus norvegicus TaxID=10116 RepID=A6KF14_RAT|nr:rCG55307 [Rattus norvegicus]
MKKQWLEPHHASAFCTSSYQLTSHHIRLGCSKRVAIFSTTLLPHNFSRMISFLLRYLY